MKKAFIFDYKLTNYFRVTVRAENQDEAEEKACQIMDEIEQDCATNDFYLSGYYDFIDCEEI